MSAPMTPTPTIPRDLFAAAAAGRDAGLVQMDRLVAGAPSDSDHAAMLLLSVHVQAVMLTFSLNWFAEAVELRTAGAGPGAVCGVRGSDILRYRDVVSRAIADVVLAVAANNEVGTPLRNSALLLLNDVAGRLLEGLARIEAGAAEHSAPLGLADGALRELPFDFRQHLTRG